MTDYEATEAPADEDPAPPEPPSSLGQAGRSVWSNVLATYVLRADELLTLEDACATSDMIANLTSEWSVLGRPLTSKGSMGQEVIHPLIAEIRTQRAARNALWRQLKLPDLDGSAPTWNATSDRARRAANSRWTREKWKNPHGA